jgi:hypothetical protein
LLLEYEVQACVRFTSPDILLVLLSICTLTKIGVSLSFYIFVSSVVFLYVSQMGPVSWGLLVVNIRNTIYGNTELAVRIFCSIIHGVP